MSLFEGIEMTEEDKITEGGFIGEADAGVNLIGKLDNDEKCKECPIYNNTTVTVGKCVFKRPENVGTKAEKGLEAIKSSLDTVLREYKNDFKNVDRYADTAFVSRASPFMLYSIYRLAVRMLVDPMCIKETPLKFYRKLLWQFVKIKFFKRNLK
jgi:hypothetical protein